MQPQDILDETPAEKPTGSKFYTLLSFGTAVINLLLVVVLGSSLSEQLPSEDHWTRYSDIVVIGLQISSVSGIVFTYLSIVKREPSSFYKWCGGIMNMLLFVMLLSFVIFAALV